MFSEILLSVHTLCKKCHISSAKAAWCSMSGILMEFSVFVALVFLKTKFHVLKHMDASATFILNSVCTVFLLFVDFVNFILCTIMNIIIHL